MAAQGDAGEFPGETVGGGSGRGGGAPGPEADPPGVQHRPAGLRGRGRHAVGAAPGRREAPGAGSSHRRRHAFRQGGIAHRPGGPVQVGLQNRRAAANLTAIILSPDKLLKFLLKVQKFFI